MDAFPAYYSLTGQTVVIAGEGEGADAKIRLFAGSPAQIVRLTGEAALDSRAYVGAVLAFIASDDRDFCVGCVAAATAARVPVNVVDRPDLSKFSTPAVIDRGSVVVAVGTGGAAPILASILRGDIENQIPEGSGRVAALLQQMRDPVREAFPEMAARRAFLREAIAGPAARAAMDGDMGSARDLLERALNEASGQRAGVLWLLDGRGPVDLLSLRALRALGEVDFVVLDDDVDAGIKSRIRRDAPRLTGISAGEILARVTAGAKLAVITAGPPETAYLEAARSAQAAAEVLPVARA